MWRVTEVRQPKERWRLGVNDTEGVVELVERQAISKIRLRFES